MSMNTMNEIEALLKAKIQCILVTTYEEQRFLDDMKQLFNNGAFQNVNLKLWSNTEGLTNVAKNIREIQGAPDPKFMDPLVLFRTIRKESGIGGSRNAWILRDLKVKEDKIQRAIRDLKEYDDNNDIYNPIFLVMPTVDIPDNIARLFRVVSYELPDTAMVKEMIVHANSSLKEEERRHPGTCEISNDHDIDLCTQACVGMTSKEVEMNLAECITRLHKLDLEFLSQNKIQVVKKTGVLDYKIPKADLESIGGNESIKQWLSEAKDAFDPAAQEFGLNKPKGYMAVGIPGAGKTAMAEAFAGTLGVPMLELSISKIMNKLVGESEKQIVYALQVARACAPCVLLLDEVEKCLGGKKSLLSR